jgi:hypothetical protein
LAKVVLTFICQNGLSPGLYAIGVFDARPTTSTRRPGTSRTSAEHAPRGQYRQETSNPSA